MRLWKRERKQTVEQKVAAAVCVALAWVNHWISWGIGHAVRGIRRGVSWLPVPARMTIFFSLAVAPAGLVWLLGQWLVEWPLRDFEILGVMTKAGWGAPLERVAWLGLVVAILQAPAIALAYWPKRDSLLAMKVACAAFVSYWGLLLYVIVAIPRALYAADSEAFWADLRNEMWINLTIWWLPGALFGVCLLLGVSLRSVREHYTQVKLDEDPFADRFLANFLTHGKDPQFRTSNYWSAAIHILPILIAILLAQGCGWDAYGIPKGSGVQELKLVKVVKVKPKPKEKIILSMNSPILYYHPPIEEAKVLEELEKATLDEYVAMSLKGGKLGKGGGKEGGWPHGMENARVRFIRLKYSGGDWNQDMGKGSDYNFLVQFHKTTGFKIASNTEALSVGRLKRFRKDRKPPFVFITGMGGIHMSSREIKILQWYCLQEGGMIFADNGGGSFDGSFRALMRRTLPGKHFVDIPNDDIIFTRPFRFPKGAPPLWHHSGTRAQGIKHNGRWVVFYHQGDMADAWKTGRSGTSKSLADASFKLGINVVNYAFNQYHRIHFEK